MKRFFYGLLLGLSAAVVALISACAYAKELEEAIWMLENKEREEREC